MLSGYISLSRLWLLCTSSMMCNNAYTSSVCFFLNRCSCIALKNSLFDIFKYTTHTRISSRYLFCRLNMSWSIPPFHQNAYPSYSSAWIVKKHMTPTCRILTTFDSFRYSILAKSGRVRLWFNRLATNSHHDWISGTPLIRTHLMVAYLPFLLIRSTTMTPVVESKTIRWHLCNVSSTCPIMDCH